MFYYYFIIEGMINVNILIMILGFTLLFLFTVFLFFNTKKIEKTDRKKLFNSMILFTILSVICELIGSVIYNNDTYYTLSLVISKVFMISVLTDLFLFTCYNFLVVKNLNNFKDSKRVFLLRRIYFFIYLISLFFIISTESLFSNSEVFNYSYGLSSDIFF